MQRVNVMLHQRYSTSDDALSKTASDQQPGPAQPQPTPDPERIDKTAPRININPDNVKSRDSIKKAYLNAVVMGHVGCGKSTVSGRLVYECDGIDEDLMTKFEREANQVTGTVFQTYFNLLFHKDAFKRFCKQSRPRSCSSYKRCLVEVYSVCLRNMFRYDPTLADLPSNFFVLCTNLKVYL